MRGGSLRGRGRGARAMTKRRRRAKDARPWRAFGLAALLALGSTGTLVAQTPELYERAQADLASYPAQVREQVEIEIKYEGYIERQSAQLAVFERLESIELPEGLDYGTIAGLSIEVVQKMELHRPATLGQASRISGITPAAISLLAAYVKAMKRPRKRAS